jgi:hypothetical protein
MAALVYEASEYNAGLPVAGTELDAILARAGKPIREDERKLIHFLQRVKETIDSLNSDLAHLRRRVDELSMQRGRLGAPSTLNPADALRYASAEEIENVVDKLSRTRLTTLRHMIAQAETEVADFVTARENTEQVINAMLAAHEITSEVASTLRESWSGAPESLSATHVLGENYFSAEDLAYEQENFPDKAAVIAARAKNITGPGAVQGEDLAAPGKATAQLPKITPAASTGTPRGSYLHADPIGTITGKTIPGISGPTFGDGASTELGAGETRNERVNAPEENDGNARLAAPSPGYGTATGTGEVADIGGVDVNSAQDNAGQQSPSGEVVGLDAFGKAPELPSFAVAIDKPNGNPFDESLRGWASDVEKKNNQATAEKKTGVKEEISARETGGANFEDIFATDTDTLNVSATTPARHTETSSTETSSTETSNTETSSANTFGESAALQKNAAEESGLGSLFDNENQEQQHGHTGQVIPAGEGEQRTTGADLMAELFGTATTSDAGAGGENEYTAEEKPALPLQQSPDNPFARLG